MLMSMNKVFCLLTLILFNHQIFAQNFAWAKSMGSAIAPTFPGERGTAITTDATGNIYTVGHFAGTVDFDPGTAVFNMSAVNGGTDKMDFFVQKLDLAGNFIWAKQISGIETSGGYGVDIDATGNVIITGFFWGTKDFDPGTGVFNLTSAGIADIFILKLDANGNFIWAKSMGGSGGEGGFGVAIDNSNNIHIVGRFEGTVDFDPGSGIMNISSAGSFDAFIVKLNSLGNIIWAKTVGGIGFEYGNSIGVDGNGNVYVAGNFTSTADFNPGTALFNLSAAGTDIYILKLSPSGDFVWVKQMVGNLASYGSGIVVHSTNVYYTGWFWGTVDFDPGSGVSSFTSLNNKRDIVIAKLNTTGELLWTKQIGGNDDDEGNAITVDNDGNVYTTGFFNLTVDFNPGAGVNNLTAGDYDVFIVKLDASGNYLWAGDAGGSDQDIGYAIHVTQDAILTTGSFRNNGDFDPGPNGVGLTSNGHSDIFIQKLTQTTTAVTQVDADIESIILSPNPVTDVTNLIVDSKKSKKLKWNIVDAKGRLIKSFTQQISNGRNTKRIYTRNLLKGEYFLIGYSEDGKTKSIPFVKYH